MYHKYNIYIYIYIHIYIYIYIIRDLPQGRCRVAALALHLGAAVDMLLSGYLHIWASREVIIMIIIIIFVMYCYYYYHYHYYYYHL